MKTFIAPITLTASLLLAASQAVAGGCPDGKEGETPFTPESEFSGDVTVHVQHTLDLEQEALKAKGWIMRARTIFFGPGAIVPLHSHDERPETAMMKHGTVTIYEMNCTVSYPMTEGAVFQSGAGDSHWAINETDEPAMMLVVDLLRPTEG